MNSGLFFTYLQKIDTTIRYRYSHRPVFLP